MYGSSSKESVVPINLKRRSDRTCIAVEIKIEMWYITQSVWYSVSSIIFAIDIS